MKKKISIFAFLISLISSCQSDYAELILHEDKVHPAENEIIKIPQITKDVNAIEVDNILNSLFNKDAKSRSNEYNISLLKDSEGTDRVICINYENNGGFALLSAQKTHTPILAFSEEGNFTNSENLPFPLNSWMDCTMDGIAGSETLPADSLQKIAEIWHKYEVKNTIVKSRAYEPTTDHSKLAYITQEEYNTLSSTIMDHVNEWNRQGYSVYTIDDYIQSVSYEEKSELMGYVASNIYPAYYEDYWAVTVVRVKDFSSQKGNGHCFNTTWDQWWGYNSSFDKTDDNITGHIPVGCTPIAIGQVMRYYKYPAYYNWDNMPNDYGTKTTSDFLLDIFTKCGTKYNPGEGSATVFDNVPDVLKSYGYSCTKIGASSLTSYLLEKSCISIISSTLDNNSGHTWVIEGSKHYTSHTEIELWTFRYPDNFSCINKEIKNDNSNLYFYANWGWGKYNDEGKEYNGYYLFDQMIPLGHSKNKIKNAIIDITHP